MIAVPEAAGSCVPSSLVTCRWRSRARRPVEAPGSQWAWQGSWELGAWAFQSISPASTSVPPSYLRALAQRKGFFSKGAWLSNGLQRLWQRRDHCRIGLGLLYVPAEARYRFLGENTLPGAMEAFQGQDRFSWITLTVPGCGLSKFRPDWRAESHGLSPPGPSSRKL